jgi:hypothetical protein
MPVRALSAVAAIAAVAVGILEARLPLGPGNTRMHHTYPFFAAALGIALVAIGTRITSPAPGSRWARRTAFTGLAYTVNAALIAGLSYSVTPEGSRYVSTGVVGWIEDWFFLIADLGFVGLLLGALPDGRLRVPAKLLIGIGVLTGVANAVVPRHIDASRVANPLAIAALKPLSGVAQTMLGVSLLLAVAVSVLRVVQLAVRSRRQGLRVGRYAISAGVVVLLVFVGQAVIPENSDLFLGGCIMAAGGTLAALLASRVVRMMTANDARG